MAYVRYNWSLSNYVTHDSLRPSERIHLGIMIFLRRLASLDSWLPKNIFSKSSWNLFNNLCYFLLKERYKLFQKICVSIKSFQCNLSAASYLVYTYVQSNCRNCRLLFLLFFLLLSFFKLICRSHDLLRIINQGIASPRWI